MKALAAALATVLLSVSLHAATIVAQPFPPARFTSLFIEKYDKGNTISVQLTDDGVVYKLTSGNTLIENVLVHPSGDDWFKFIQTLNEAKVYQWAPDYQYPGQGPTWVIDLAMEGVVFKSGGTNEYPKEGDVAKPAAQPKAGPSIPFQLFWQGVMELVGKAHPPSGTK
jgi:hypothetical protein